MDGAKPVGKSQKLNKSPSVKCLVLESTLRFWLHNAAEIPSDSSSKYVLITWFSYPFLFGIFVYVSHLQTEKRVTSSNSIQSVSQCYIQLGVLIEGISSDHRLANFIIFCWLFELWELLEACKLHGNREAFRQVIDYRSSLCAQNQFKACASRALIEVDRRSEATFVNHFFNPCAYVNEIWLKMVTNGLYESSNISTLDMSTLKSKIR